MLKLKTLNMCRLYASCTWSDFLFKILYFILRVRFKRVMCFFIFYFIIFILNYFLFMHFLFFLIFICYVFWFFFALKKFLLQQNIFNIILLFITINFLLSKHSISNLISDIINFFLKNCTIFAQCSNSTCRENHTLKYDIKIR